MGKMKQFGLWLLQNKKLTDENIVRLAKTTFDIEDSQWIREQIALLRSGELEKLMGVTGENLYPV